MGAGCVSQVKVNAISGAGLVDNFGYGGRAAGTVNCQTNYTGCGWGDGVAGSVWERRAEAAIGNDAEDAATFDAPSASGGAGGVEMSEVG